MRALSKPPGRVGWPAYLVGVDDECAIEEAANRPTRRLPRPASMSYFEAAIKILEQAGKPLTTREVTDAAIKAGLLKPKGKTPEATMSAVLYTSARDDIRVVKLATPGASRAQRGSVRWSVRKAR